MIKHMPDASLTTEHCTYQSCLGAKGTTQSLLETLVGLLRCAVAIKSSVDAWDGLQCSKAVAKFELYKLSKLLVAQCS